MTSLVEETEMLTTMMDRTLLVAPASRRRFSNVWLINQTAGETPAPPSLCEILHLSRNKAAM
jgi:hypothetical protein